MDELAIAMFRLSDLERCNADLDRLEDENAKLRELVYRMVSYVSNPPCYGCSFEMTCDGHDITRCDEWSLIVSDARRAGIEVD